MNIQCLICGGVTTSVEKKKGIGSKPAIVHTCVNPLCSSVFIQEYDYETNAVSDKVFLDKTKDTDSNIWNRYKYVRLLPEEMERILAGERLHSIEQKQSIPDLCSICSRSTGGTIIIENIRYCWNCAKEKIEGMGVGILSTTGTSLEGYLILKHLDVDYSISLMVPGFFGIIDARITDNAGSNTEIIEDKLYAITKYSLALLKAKAKTKGANAILGIRFDIKEFFQNYLCVTTYGTLAVLEKNTINNS